MRDGPGLHSGGRRFCVFPSEAEISEVGQRPVCASGRASDAAAGAAASSSEEEAAAEEPPSKALSSSASAAAKNLLKKRQQRLEKNFQS